MARKSYHCGVRMTEGVDVWTCDHCGAVNIMGRNHGICTCGRDYLDVLKSRNQIPKAQKAHESANPEKLRLPDGNWKVNPQPVSGGGICQSFLKIKPTNSQEKKK